VSGVDNGSVGQGATPEGIAQFSIIITLFSPRGHNDRNHRGFGHPVWPPDLRSSRAGCSSACSGVVYLVAFVSLALQITGLVESTASFPRAVPRTGARAYGSGAYRLFPTLCWLGASDGMLHALAWGGAVLPCCSWLGSRRPRSCWVLWICYLSLTVAARPSSGSSGTGCLLETGLWRAVRAIQLRPSLVREPAPSTAMRWLVWALVFRFDVPLRYHEAREWRPHVAHLTASTTTSGLNRFPLAGVVRAVARMDAPGDDARDHRDRRPW